MRPAASNHVPHRARDADVVATNGANSAAKTVRKKPPRTRTTSLNRKNPIAARHQGDPLAGHAVVPVVAGRVNRKPTRPRQRTTRIKVNPVFPGRMKSRIKNALTRKKPQMTQHPPSLEPPKPRIRVNRLTKTARRRPARTSLNRNRRLAEARINRRIRPGIKAARTSQSKPARPRVKRPRNKKTVAKIVRSMPTSQRTRRNPNSLRLSKPGARTLLPRVMPGAASPRTRPSQKAQSKPRLPVRRKSKTRPTPDLQRFEVNHSSAAAVYIPGDVNRSPQMPATF